MFVWFLYHKSEQCSQISIFELFLSKITSWKFLMNIEYVHYVFDVANDPQFLYLNFSKNVYFGPKSVHSKYLTCIFTMNELCNGQWNEWMNFFLKFWNLFFNCTFLTQKWPWKHQQSIFTTTIPHQIGQCLQAWSPMLLKIYNSMRNWENQNFWLVSQGDPKLMTPIFVWKWNFSEKNHVFSKSISLARLISNT